MGRAHQRPSGLKRTANSQGGRWRNREVDPDTKMAEAHAKAGKLQKALNALGTGGSEVDAIKRSLKKAQKKVAGERPILELMKECREFVDPSTKLQAELNAETVLLQESRARLVMLEVQQAATSATPADTGRGAHVGNLQQMVNQLQAERDTLSQDSRRSRAPMDMTFFGSEMHIQI